MVDIKDIDPYKDEWDSSMLPKFNNEQLINCLHFSLDTIYEITGLNKGLSKLGRLFFNSIIIEIKERMK